MFDNLHILRKNNFLYVKGSHHRVKLPKITKKLSLFLGMLWGDGWLIARKKASLNSQWRVGMVEDDIKIIREFCNLSKELFKVKAGIHDRKTKVEAYICSRVVYEFLNQICGFPDGEKLNRLEVPSLVKTTKNIFSFLKGLYSTDGKFVIYKNYPRIGLDSATLKLILQIKEIEERLGFNPRIYRWKRKKGNNLYGLNLNGKEQIKLFNNRIGFIGKKDKLLKRYLNRIKSPVV